jgi:hypothetical protein
MMTLIKWALVLLVCLVGIGFYRHWFTISKSAPDPQSNKIDFRVSVDSNKMKKDAEVVKHEVKKDVEKLTGKAAPKAAQPGEPAQPQGSR